MESKLLGDMTQDTLKVLGADKLAKFYERKTGRTCNCGNRVAMLNNLHRAAQRIIERQNSSPKPQQLRPPIIDKDVYQPPIKPVDET